MIYKPQTLKEYRSKVSGSWTDRELEILKENYESMGKKILTILPHRSFDSIRSKVKRMRASEEW